ncbi:MAG: hypothetical protein A2V58_08110 [Candidatus Muproteobacteria bacterium RBG_19FT_COMBO_61_10]|uniref:Uncharacterized protein n=1 Tax=Candidatus Muproteobacteria bacterium RBG_19FT_COMBO_61_10 TaxID=1817761 RepID=A0A1F6UKL1_9PROT|nr:MAG: hypothetical protein A2V58_08110 [Candidatus Muproteobacteria bacterium RBG_19FT_COMBO_61_10]
MVIPPSPCTGSTSTATTLLLLSPTSLTASRSLKGTRLNPRSSGSKPAWILRLPLADRVARVRPWKLPSMTIMEGSRILRWCACRRASLMAASFASAPELQKKALSMPEIWQTAWASFSCNGM